MLNKPAKVFIHAQWMYSNEQTNKVLKDDQILRC